MWNDNTGVVCSIPPCVTVKRLLVRKATRNYLVKSTSLEKNLELSLVSATSRQHIPNIHTHTSYRCVPLQNICYNGVFTKNVFIDMFIYARISGC